MTPFRNLIALSVVFTLTALAVGCASTPAAKQVAPAAAEQVSAQADRLGPFDVAQKWAAKLPALQSHEADLPEAVDQIVHDWTSAQVERVWADGPRYRAVIVQKSTSTETPAVLLHMDTDGNGGWKVVSLEPTTSTELWSEL